MTTLNRAMSVRSGAIERRGFSRAARRFAFDAAFRSKFSLCLCRRGESTLRLSSCAGVPRIRWGKLGPQGRMVMAKVIEFYIPKNFRKDERRSERDERGRVIEFSLPKKSA